MIPIRDTVQSKNKPTMVRSIIVINVLVFIFQYLFLGDQASNFLYTFAFIPNNFSEPFWNNPQSLLHLYSIVTCMFLHGGLSHIISNMWVLWIFGDNVEDKMGHKNFLLFYLLCGVIANITQFAFDPTSTIPVIGASGAIAGVMGAYFMMFKNSRILTVIPWFPPLFVKIPAVVYLFVWFISQVLSGAEYILSQGGSASGVAWWAHIGGFIGGAILYRFFLKKNNYDQDIYID